MVMELLNRLYLINGKKNCYGNTDALQTVYCEVLYIEAYYEGYDLNDYALDYSNCPMDEVLEETQNTLQSNINTGSSMTHYLAKQSVNSLLDSYEQNEVELIKYNMNKEKLSGILTSIESRLTSNTVLKTDYSVDDIGDGTVWIACATYYMERYLNLEAVQTALHVTTTGWSKCSSDVFYNWPVKDWHNGMEKIYHTLVEDYDIKILIYSGDDDSVCGLGGTMYWLTRMGWTEDSQHKWESWTIDGQLSGYYTKYLKSDGDTAIHFHTVRSAGHMVPQTQPERSLKLLQKFLYDFD